MNKASNVPPGPSLKGGKNRTRRGGGGNNLKKYPARRQLLPFNNTLKKYPARRQLLPFNYISGLESERKKLNEEIMKLIDKTNVSNNSKEHDIEILQKRIDEIDKLIHKNINSNVANQVHRNANVQAELNALTKGGKRKSGRTRRSRN